MVQTLLLNNPVMFAHTLPVSSLARPLFYGDDYRPELRPSSSYIVAEQTEMERRQSDVSSKPAVDSPSASMLPPRTHHSAKPKKGKEGAPTESNSGSTTQIKLVHAPPVPCEAGNPLDTAEDDYDSENDASGKKAFDPESSLALPSTVRACVVTKSLRKGCSNRFVVALRACQTELVASYHEIDDCLTRLVSAEPTRDPTAFSAEVDRLCRMTERFIDLSTFLQSGSPRQAATDGQDVAASNAQLCARLFHQLCAATLDRWSALPAVVLELTPSLVQLFASTRTTGDSTATNQAVQLGKLLFMLSKDSANDRAFCSIRYVEAALDAISSTSVAASTRRGSSDSRDEDAGILLDPSILLFPMKTLIYVAGTLKNLSSGAEERMLKLLATHRCIPILSETLLWRRADSGQDAGVASKNIAQLLVQTTGILRNLSASKSNSKQFLEARISARLCAVIPDFMKHQELMVNVSQILSKLTLHERPRAQINETPENVGHLVALVNPKRNAWLSSIDHPPQQQAGESKSQDILFVRVFFVLGNLCASNDRNREAIAFKHHGVGVMLHVLQFYGLRYIGSQDSSRATGSGGDDAATSVSEQTVEILVKLVRALANIAINTDIAAELNARQELAVLPDLLRHALDFGDEELMLNAVSFVTNLSFFHCGQSSRQQPAKGEAMEDESEADDGFVAQHRLEIAAVLARILLDPNEEAVLEAARTFGNLSRHADVLAFMRERKVLDCFVLLLDHSSREIVFAVCGVLMNAALDRETRRALMKVSAAPAVVDSVSQDRNVSPPVEICGLLTGILVDCAAADDVEMALVAGKALFNLLLRGTSGEEKCLPVATVATLRRVVESVMETLEHPVSSLRARSRSGKRHGDGDDDDDGGDNSDSYEEAAGGDRDAVGRMELSSLLPQLLRSVNSF